MGVVLVLVLVLPPLPLQLDALMARKLTIPQQEPYHEQTVTHVSYAQCNPIYWRVQMTHLICPRTRYYLVKSNYKEQKDKKER